MNAQDIALLNEILEDLTWARSILNISDDFAGDNLDVIISKLTMRIEELENGQ